jgi:hypothetical protein
MARAATRTDGAITFPWQLPSPFLPFVARWHRLFRIVPHGEAELAAKVRSGVAFASAVYSVLQLSILVFLYMYVYSYPFIDRSSLVNAPPFCPASNGTLSGNFTYSEALSAVLNSTTVSSLGCQVVGNASTALLTALPLRFYSWGDGGLWAKLF